MEAGGGRQLVCKGRGNLRRPDRRGGRGAEEGRGEEEVEAKIRIMEDQCDELAVLTEQAGRF